MPRAAKQNAGELSFIACFVLRHLVADSGPCQIAKTENNDLCQCFAQLQSKTGQCLMTLYTTEVDRNKQSNVRTGNFRK